MHVLLAHRGQGWMPAVPGSRSPVRNTSELSGRSIPVSPVAQSSAPAAAVESVLITQTLVGALFLFGIARGAPK
jgi:hypothetical protein